LLTEIGLTEIGLTEIGLTESGEPTVPVNSGGRKA
jgi:hypothetical protein